METHRKRIIRAVLSSVMVLAAISVGGNRVLARQQDPPKQQQTPQGQPQAPTTTTLPDASPPAQPIPGQASSQEEFEAYRAVEAATDSNVKVDLGEKFLAKYPESGMTGNVYRYLMYAFQQLNDAPKSILYAERYLNLVPSDVEAMSVLAFLYAESRNHEQGVQRANRANQLLETFVPPPNITPQQWQKAKTNLQSMNYSTLGYCHLLRGRGLKDAAEKKTAYETAISDFQRALELNPRDDYSYFRMGMAYSFLSDLDKSIASYAKSVAVGGVAERTARGELERVYKLAHNGSLEGLEDVLQKAKDELVKLTAPTP